jgi:hypothetical protein
LKRDHGAGQGTSGFHPRFPEKCYEKTKNARKVQMSKCPFGKVSLDFF